MVLGGREGGEEREDCGDGDVDGRLGLWTEWRLGPRGKEMREEPWDCGWWVSWLQLAGAEGDIASWSRSAGRYRCGAGFGRPLDFSDAMHQMSGLGGCPGLVVDA